MSTTLNDLAMELVGTEASPFFVTLVHDMEFDGAPSTIAAFTTIEDAVSFAEAIFPNANEAIVIEGPSGIYLELTQGKRVSFMPAGKIAITTALGKAVITAN